jgi:hypothetical protein
MVKRLTVVLSDDEHKQIKVAAAAAGLSMGDVLRRLLALWLAGKVKLPKK